MATTGLGSTPSGVPEGTVGRIEVPPLSEGFAAHSLTPLDGRVSGVLKKLDVGASRNCARTKVSVCVCARVCSSLHCRRPTHVLDVHASWWHALAWGGQPGRLCTMCLRCVSRVDPSLPVVCLFSALSHCAHTCSRVSPLLRCLLSRVSVLPRPRSPWRGSCALRFSWPWCISAMATPARASARSARLQS